MDMCINPKIDYNIDCDKEREGGMGGEVVGGKRRLAVQLRLIAIHRDVSE